MAKPKKSTDEVSEPTVEVVDEVTIEKPIADVPVEVETPVKPVASKEQITKKPVTVPRVLFVT